MVSSSPPPSSPVLGHHSSPTTTLAFLVHSPTTVANSLPPDVDNKPLARQKRRRTSKEDEEVLKAEYQRNPKPDKTVRIEIASKVALGEKEVAIWFQNKRQNDRRRARPLEPSSTPPLMSSSSNMSDPPTEDDAPAPADAKAAQSPERDDAPPAEQQPEARLEQPAPAEPADAADEARTIEPADTTEPEQVAKPESQSTLGSDPAPYTDPRTLDTAPTEVTGSQQALPSSQGTSQPPTSWISNRRSASFVRYGDDYVPETIAFPHPTPPSTEPPPSARSLKRTHSFVRISTNEDGTARVVTDLDKTPSPPHPRTNPAPFSRAAAGLRRSYSAAGLNERLVAAQEERSPKVPRTSSNIGRSRDSRAWEFWCDPDSRHNTSLTKRAEQEGSGSAADAIGLLRTNRRILAQNQARQNALMSRQQLSKTSSDYRVKKPRGPMQRASTTHGRLQSKENPKCCSSGSDSDDFPQTESDKENWEPDTPHGSHRPGPLLASSQRIRQVLGENTDVMSQSTSLGNLLARDKAQSPSKGARRPSDPEQDEELRSFMDAGGASGRTTVSSAEEAGCVEGLLKLSQGQWR